MSMVTTFMKLNKKYAPVMASVRRGSRKGGRTTKQKISDNIELFRRVKQEEGMKKVKRIGGMRKKASLNPFLQGFVEEIEKIAITRPAVEWFPEDHTDDSSPMLHRTAESHMFTGKQYTKKKGKYKEDFSDMCGGDEGNEGNSNHACEISDPVTAYHISTQPQKPIGPK